MLYSMMTQEQKAEHVAQIVSNRTQKEHDDHVGDALCALIQRAEFTFLRSGKPEDFDFFTLIPEHKIEKLKQYALENGVDFDGEFERASEMYCDDRD